MKKGAKKSERNGKVYLGAWIDKDLDKKAREKAKGEKRSFGAQLEVLLYEYISR
jgi:hypothetical protein